MSVLSHKFKITGVENYDFKEIKEVLSTVFYTAFHITNEVVSEYHNFNVEKKRYKDETGTVLNTIETLGYKYFKNYASNKHKDRLIALGLGSDGRDGFVNNAIDVYDKKRADIAKGNAVIPQMRRDTIELNFRGRSTIVEGNVLTTSVLTREKAKEINQNAKDGKVSFIIDLGRKARGKQIIDRINSGEYKICDSCIKTDGKNGYYIKLSFLVPDAEPTELDVDKILGVDIGITNAAVLTVDGTPHNLFINGGEIEAFTRRIEGRRKSMRNQLKVCSDNRRGHGSKALMKPLDVLTKKVADFQELTNHRYAKKIVDFAVKHGCGTIQIEDLSGINTQSAFLARWSYYSLQQKIDYKAKIAGVKIVKIKPAYTSQRCNKCGCIDVESRPTQDTYNCTTCGHKANADLNAARNIATKDIEKIIAQQIKAQSK